MSDDVRPAEDEDIALRQRQMDWWPGVDVTGNERWAWERQLIARIDAEKARADAAENARAHLAALREDEHRIYADNRKHIAELEAENAALRDELREVKKDLAEHMRRP